MTGGNGFLTQNGKEAGSAVSDQIVTHLTLGRGGWYYIDEARMDLCFVDASFGTSYRVTHLDTEWDGASRILTSAAPTREESALLLLDGSILTRADAEGVRELTGVLRPSTLRAALALAKYAVFALAAAALLWLLLCGLRRGYASLVIFRGGLFVAAALLCFTVLHFGWLLPMQRRRPLHIGSSGRPRKLTKPDAWSRSAPRACPSGR